MQDDLTYRSHGRRLGLFLPILTTYFSIFALRSSHPPTAIRGDRACRVKCNAPLLVPLLLPCLESTSSVHDSHFAYPTTRARGRAVPRPLLRRGILHQRTTSNCTSGEAVLKKFLEIARCGVWGMHMAYTPQQTMYAVHGTPANSLLSQLHCTDDRGEMSSSTFFYNYIV